MKKYNNNSAITEYANYIIGKYLKQKWNFGICLFVNRNNLHHNCGLCYHQTNTILLNDFIINRISLEKVKMVVLHEVAHAMCNEEGNYNIGHDDLWYINYNKIGGNDKYYTENEEGIMRFNFEKNIKNFLKNLNIEKYQ